MDKKVFLKALVHPSDTATRDSGVDLCEKWIPLGNHSKLDWLAVWKALHYCMWHSDKPLVQHSLARRLSSMQYLCPDNQQWLYLMSSFWETMSREWNGLDRLRVDKFLSLLRYFFRDTIKIMKTRKLTTDELADITKILSEGPFNIKTDKGIIFHMADIFWEELMKVNKKFLNNTELLFPLLMPFFRILAIVEEDTANRLRNAIFIQLIKDHIQTVSYKKQISILEFICEQLLNNASRKDIQNEQREILYELRGKVYKKLFIIKSEHSRPIPNNTPPKKKS